MAKWPYRGAWTQVRRAILQRDRHTCQIGGPGCEGRATHVDHIVPLMHGGHPYAPSNLRAACRHCNIVRGNDMRAGVEQRNSRDW